MKIVLDLLSNEDRQEVIHQFLNEVVQGHWRYDSDDKSKGVHVTGSVNMSGMNLVEIPVCFITVSSDFICDDNKLTSLKCSPNYIGGDFYCRHNVIESLEDGPSHVNGNYYADYNELFNLNGIPDVINQHLSVSYNNIGDFNYTPRLIKESLDIRANWIDSLDGIGIVKGIVFLGSNPIDNPSLDISKDELEKTYNLSINFTLY